MYRHLSLKQAFFIIVLFNSFSILLCAIAGYRIYTSAYNRLLFASLEGSLSVTSAQISQSMENVEYISTLLLSSSSIQQQLSEAQTQADRILADAHAAARREHDKLLSDAQKELKDLAVTATEKLVLQSDGDAFDQFLDAAERGESHA